MEIDKLPSQAAPEKERVRLSGGRMKASRKSPQLCNQPGAHSKPHSLPEEMPSGPNTRDPDTQRAKLYPRAEVRGDHKSNPEREDIEGRVRRALWVHRWLSAPDMSHVAQLKGGGSSWPTPAPDWHQYGWEGRGPRPRFSPREISDHDIIFGIPPEGYSGYPLKAVPHGS